MKPASGPSQRTDHDASTHAPERIDAVRFEDATCRNCAAELSTPYCGRCGQKRARRLGLRDLGRESWEKWRLFEAAAARTAARLLVTPGSVARDYVFGMRARHFHPLKLLLVLVAMLVLALSRIGYLRSADRQANEAMALAQAYGNWSFTLGLFAILAGSLLLFRRRLGYNAVEHLVLAAYCQSVIIALNLVNLAPLLAWPSPAFIAAHKAAAQWYMVPLEAAVVAIAFRQFFLLDWRRDAWRLLAALLVYVAVNWLLLRAYAHLVVQLVLARTT